MSPQSFNRPPPSGRAHYRNTSSRLRLERLEAREVPAVLVAQYAVGEGAGGSPLVKVYNTATGDQVRSFLAYGASFTGGVSVATGDINGDGIDDIITGAGAGGGPHVKVFDGNTGSEIRSFFAYAATFRGGVNVALGDVNGDGKADIITGAGAGGGPHVKVFDGNTGAEIRSFFAYDATFHGGVSVAMGDFNGDFHADIVTGAGAGGGPHVKVFDGDTGAEMRSFFAYDASFHGGVNVAAGDTNGDGHTDIITGAGAGNEPLVNVFDGQTSTKFRSFLAYAATFRGGVRVGTTDLDANGIADIITGAGPGGGPHVKIFDSVSRTERSSFFAFDGAFNGGVFVGGEMLQPHPPTNSTPSVPTDALVPLPTLRGPVVIAAN